MRINERAVRFNGIALTAFGYVWVLDLSGTLQGAGGVGGLLAVIRPDGTFFPCYDGNGNVTEYVDVSGAVRASYRYSPFGETVERWGDLADTFLFRFSTKLFHQATGLYKYQLRDFSPSLGCWLSRDPIEEEGGVNLYVVCDNNTVCFYDTLGLVKMITVPWKVMRIREGLLSIVSGNPLDYISIKWKILKGIKSAYDLYGRYTDAQLTTVRAIELFSQDVPWCYVLKRIERGRNAEFDSIELGGGEGVFGSILEARIRFKVIDTHVYGPPDNRSGW